jgi:hypothetical protein
MKQFCIFQAKLNFAFGNRWSYKSASADGQDFHVPTTLLWAIVHHTSVENGTSGALCQPQVMFLLCIRNGK